jgi:hypothetical protein
MPNLRAWQPGDIVLFSPRTTSFDLLGQAIQFIQGYVLGQPPDDARWVHAAVYLGDGVCVESVRKAISNSRRGGVLIDLGSLEERLRSQYVRVRRLKPRHGGSPAIGKDIAMRALDRTALPYPNAYSMALTLSVELQQLVSLAPQAFFKLIRSTHAGGAKHCSMLCGDALNDASGIDLFAGKPGRPNLPYVLSQTTFLEDVDVRWCRT